MSKRLFVKAGIDQLQMVLANGIIKGDTAFPLIFVFTAYILPISLSCWEASCIGIASSIPNSIAIGHSLAGIALLTTWGQQGDSGQYQKGPFHNSKIHKQFFNFQNPYCIN